MANKTVTSRLMSPSTSLPFLSFPFLLFPSLPFATIQHLHSCYRANLIEHCIISALPYLERSLRAVLRAVFSRGSGRMLLKIEKRTSKLGKRWMPSRVNDIKPLHEVLPMPMLSSLMVVPNPGSIPPPPTCSDTVGCQHRPPAVDNLRLHPLSRP